MLQNPGWTELMKLNKKENKNTYHLARYCWINMKWRGSLHLKIHFVTLKHSLQNVKGLFSHLQRLIFA